jgi:hypothetical protein
MIGPIVVAHLRIGVSDMKLNVIVTKRDPFRFHALNEGEVFFVSGGSTPYVKVTTTQACPISVTRHFNDGGGLQAIDMNTVVTRVEQIDLYVMEGQQ